MNKTVLQSAIEALNNSASADTTHPHHARLIYSIVEQLTRLIPLEKQQIIEAHGAGQILIHDLFKENLAKYIPKLNMEASSVEVEKTRNGEPDIQAEHYFISKYKTHETSIVSPESRK